MDDVYALEGEKTTLRCHVPLAVPRAQIKWKFADTQIFLDEANDSSYQIKAISPTKSNSAEYESISELTIKIVSKSDKNRFVCIAVNTLAVSQYEASLTIEFKPEFLQNFKLGENYFSWNLEAEAAAYMRNEFLPVEYTCLTEGYPIPAISWYFRNELIVEDNFKYRLLKNEPNYSKMEVSPKTLDDFGEYRCVSENKHGRVEKSFFLRYATKPKQTPVIFEKNIESDSIIVEIKQNTETKSGINDPEHEITYELPIEAYQIQWIEANANWSQPNEIIFSLNKQDLKETRIYAEITDLTPDTEYIFRSAAINKVGVSDFKSNEIKIRTKMRQISMLVMICVAFIGIFILLSFLFLFYYLISTIIKTYKSRPKYVRLIVRV